MFGPPTPILRSFDERRAKRFYVDFLGFEILFEHRFEPGTPLYMGLRKGDCWLHLSEHYCDGTPGSALRIKVEDVKAFARGCMRTYLILKEKAARWNADAEIRTRTAALIRAKRRGVRR